MSSANRPSDINNKVLVFGPQALSFSEGVFHELRSAIVEATENAWILDVIAGLPACFNTLCVKLPKLQAVQGLHLLESLDVWLTTGTVPPAAENLPNILLTPLVVLTQLTQYSKYVRIEGTSSGFGNDPYSARDHQTRILGFCTGLLSGLAISCASKEAELQKYGAAAVRLAVLIGALVDLQELTGPHGQSKSFATAWSSVEQRADMTRVLQRYHEAYVSVNYDENRATVTTSAKTAFELQKDLRAVGIVATEVNLHGRFHCECYRDELPSLSNLCDSTPDLQLPDASQAVIPIHSISGGDVITTGKLHHIALSSILLEQAQWHQTFDAVYSSSLSDKRSLLINFGLEKCVPPSFARSLTSQVVNLSNWAEASARLSANEAKHSYSDNDIAVVGMAVKVAGADDLEEFWELMCKAQSQHIEVPPERFTFDTHWREIDPKRKWYGNFVRDHDAFDHKFFKKSPREMVSVDPQQRLFLQSAYQAVEQSGYFNSPDADSHVGVFVGVCAADYEANIACYPPSAFSATGNLKSFIAGKISHYFGWTGPGLTIDTACSASAVAVHQACRAILGGECNAALAGGTTVMTSPLWFQNLAGASFLSPTGACKPFDAKADGYCRGEAVSSVFLKKMSQAVEDGDTIFGCIRSSAVYQNENCTPIFVPNSSSLSSLFETVVRKAGLQPKDISLVEAHGTGTSVGDPAEYDSIRKVFGGPHVRSSPILLGSVKGLVGHTECASGIIALIKVLMLIQEGKIPPQASFSSLAPNIKATPSDMLEIVTHMKTWDVDHRAALINNYGASGSNASMIVTQSLQYRSTATPSQGTGTIHPFWITGFDERSLLAYAERLRASINRKALSPEKVTMANFAFAISRQSNRNLDKGLIFNCSSVAELDGKLAAFLKGDKSMLVTKRNERPVILCFGGQTSRSVGLDRNLYTSASLLRRHLDQCNSVLESLGLPGLYPDIFSNTPTEDVVKLQTMLFALQFSCARSWIDSGIKPAAIVGHSFGELTALAISGVLSLHDTIKIIAARAQVVADGWGAEKGAMMAVEGDFEDIQQLLVTASKNCQDEAATTIACYNGPRSFTLAGTNKGIGAVAECLTSVLSIKAKRLGVSNAFHSTLVEPLIPSLLQIGKDLTFHEPTVPWERATESQADAQISPSFFADHMREPVYANHAFQRLAKRFPSAVWLEAGSNSTITKMASKALGAPRSSHFQSANLLGEAGLQNLAEATVELWREGIRVSYWSHHPWQAYDYSPLILPPYQFEKSRHWLELKRPQKLIPESVPQHQLQSPEMPTRLYTFVGYQDELKRSARFRINTMIKKYEDLISGHLVAQTAPICPATLEVDIAIEALLSLRPDFETSNMQPGVHDVENLAPICANLARAVWLDLHVREHDFHHWDWRYISTDAAGSESIVHVKGQLIMRSAQDAQLKTEFARYERLVGYDRCSELLNCSDPDDTLQGRNIYKLFSEIVDYGEAYRGLQKLVGKDNESAGRVIKQRSGETWLDTHLSDCFSQVGGFWVNCMTDRSPADMYIAAGFETWLRLPRTTLPATTLVRPCVWDVFACHHRASDKAYTTDIFIFDAARGELAELILGINYAKVSKASMSKILKRLTVDSPKTVAAPSTPERMVSPSTRIEAVPAAAQSVVPPDSVKQTMAAITPKARKEPKKTHELDVQGIVLDIIADLSGLDLDVIKPDAKLADLGIDSLMGMEMAHELESKFKCEMNMDELAEVVSVQDVMRCVSSVLGVMDGGSAAAAVGETDEDDDDEPTASGSQSPHSSADSMTSVSSGGQPQAIKTTQPETCELQIPPVNFLDAFAESKQLTDRYIMDFKCAGYLDDVNPKQTQLCVALAVEAFEQLGCPLKTARAGERLNRIEHAPQHARLAEFLYSMLEDDARLVDLEGDNIVRTSVSPPIRTAEAILKSLEVYTDHAFANRLTYFCGTRLAEVLLGKVDGVKLIFGSEEGRELVAGLYGDSLLNKLDYKLMEDFVTRLVSKLPRDQGPLHILEMGAGTGGTTKYLVPLLAKLEVPVVYTFTDLAPSFVAAARKKFKAYPFMRFRAHDIEKEPAEDLIGTQHLIVASNAVHATHSLTVSAKNIRKALRPDGCLLMLEMTQTLHWVDMIFGLLEGWWLFDDGRRHAISHESRWERELHAVGFGHVDWTDGHLPENSIQRIIIAFASGPKHERLPVPPKPAQMPQDDNISRQAAVADYVRKYTSDFVVSNPSSGNVLSQHCVLVTGATGSLGSHLVQYLAEQETVSTVICLNRYTRGSLAGVRQRQSLTSRSIELDDKALSKLRVFETETSQPNLGLPREQYEDMVNTVTHIVHNAWPMSGKRPVSGFEAQFRVMRNLIHLARDVACRSALRPKLGFQFISSIATTGHYPVRTGDINVPEQRMSIDDVLPNGYGDAKFVCENMLDETLHKHSDCFRTMSVRLGQVAGSSTSGYWNSLEHLSFLIKSSQTLKCLPNFEGTVSWTPVNDVAATLGELLISSATPYPIYHIDNPVGQPWKQMILTLANCLNVPMQTGIVPFEEWVRRVRNFSGSVEKDNPAFKLIDFLDTNFLRMSCGGLLLETKHSREHSKTLRELGPVSEDVVRGYVRYWQRIGFLARSVMEGQTGS